MVKGAMSEIITSEQLVNELVRLSGLLEEATEDFRSKARDEAIKDSDYRKSKALSYLSASGPVAERQAHVDKVCTEDRERFYLARAEKEAGLEYLRSLRQQLSAMQSIAASARSEMELAGRDYSRR